METPVSINGKEQDPNLALAMTLERVVGAVERLEKRLDDHDHRLRVVENNDIRAEGRAAALAERHEDSGHDLSWGSVIKQNPGPFALLASIMIISFAGIVIFAIARDHGTASKVFEKIPVQQLEEHAK